MISWKASSRLWILLLIVLIFVLPLFVKGYFIYVLDLVGIHILIALGLNLLTGYCGQLSLGHAAFFALGAFTSGFLTLKGVPFLLALPAAGCLPAAVAYLVGIPVLRLRLIFLAIATVGLGIIAHDVLYNWKAFTGGSEGLILSKPRIGPWLFKTDGSIYYIIAGVVILLSLLLWNIARSKIGRAFLAIRESERAATAAGIDVPRYRMLAFLISAFYTGVAGSLYAHLTAYVNITAFDIMMSITFLSMIIIGGVASIPGSILGALFVVIIPETLRDLPGAKDLQALIYGLLLGFFLIFLPGGLVSGFGKVKARFASPNSGKGSR